MTKRTKVITPKVPIGVRSNPTSDGLKGLADVASRLLKAVQPHLRGSFDNASSAVVELEADHDAEAAAGLDSDREVADAVPPAGSVRDLSSA